MAAVRRLLFSSLAFASGALLGYELGYARGKQLEEVVDSTYRVTGPDKRNYLVDFERRSVRPEYSSLEELFEVNHGK
ncbi:MAG: hypothetical protein Q7S65_01175 [Nanoarchaeota archaeon]|nr:hypothetical protein [Nanoarchaeota archaeon]